MKTVLLFFCAILGILLFCILLLMFSSIRLNVAKAKISNFENGIKKKKIEQEFIIYLELSLFNKIKIARIRLKKGLLYKVKNKANIKEIKRDTKILKNIGILEILKKLKIKVSKLELEAKFGTEDIILTVFLVTLLSSIFSVLIRNCNYKKVHYNIMPLYEYGNTIKFNLNCIISVKMVHIIYVIYILLKKGRINNERTSNRRAYDYSYE